MHNMVVVLYICTIFVFFLAVVVGGMVVQFLILTIKRGFGKEPELGTPFPAWPFFFYSYILMAFTHLIWAKMGYHAGWLLTGILAFVYFLWGNTPDKTMQNLGYGTMFGILVAQFMLEF